MEQNSENENFQAPLHTEISIPTAFPGKNCLDKPSRKIYQNFWDNDIFVTCERLTEICAIVDAISMK